MAESWASTACTGGGGWILGHLIDGTQAEYVRVPFADTSTYLVPEAVSDEALLMLASPRSASPPPGQGAPPATERLHGSLRPA